MLIKKAEGRTKTELAREIGVSRQNLYQIMKGERGAGPKVLAYLGLRRVVEIRKAIYGR